MIPEIDPQTIDNIGERIVYRALRDQLPPSWSVRYHFPYCKQVGIYLRDGEADFIVVVPQRGILFLEVKSSHGFDCVDGEWYRIKQDGRRERCDNPFEQATKTKHEVVDQILCPRLGCSKSNFPGIYGHAVMYPLGKLEGSIPASQDPGVLIAFRDMRRLAERLESAFHAWGKKERGDLFSADVTKSVLNALRDKASFVTVVAADTEDVGHKIEQLTRQQYETYQGLLANPRALVPGRAGSGKTMLALWTAIALASRGKRTLFLCYNRNLAAWLRQRNGDVENLGIEHFHATCSRLSKTAGISWPSQIDEPTAFWSNIAPGKLIEALDLLPTAEKYDAVIVDEGQDFDPNWWIPIELLLRHETTGYFYIFFDPDQAIQFTSGNAYPEIATTFRLDVNCRNTRRIARYSGNVIQATIKSREGAPDGVAPAILEPQATAAERASTCLATLKQLINDGYRASDIAVISPWRRDNSNSALGLLAGKTAHNASFEDRPEHISRWLQGEVIWMSTIKSFKGLEAECLIITDLPGEFLAGFSANDLYVAASRGKQKVIFLPVSESAHTMLKAFVAKD
jgi:hypothetical protein